MSVRVQEIATRALFTPPSLHATMSELPDRTICGIPVDRPAGVRATREPHVRDKARKAGGGEDRQPNRMTVPIQSLAMSRDTRTVRAPLSSAVHAARTWPSSTIHRGSRDRPGDAPSASG